MKPAGIRSTRVAGWCLSVALVFCLLVVSASSQTPQEPEAKQPKVILSTSSHALKFAKDPTQAEMKSFTLSASGGTITGNIGEPAVPFSIASGGGAFTLNPGDSPHTVTVQFAPSKRGTFHSAIIINSNAKDNKLKISLSGIANGPIATSTMTPTVTATATVTSTPTVAPTPTSTATIALPIASGDVLFTGGLESGGADLSSAEVYDPTAGTFLRTGSMSARRFFHAAILLGNGKVLVTGGAYLSTAELFDRSTGGFTSINMGEVHAYHTSSLLSDGNVLIVSGANGISTAPTPPPTPGPTSTATPGPGVRFVPFAHTFGCDCNGELYDPTKDSLSSTKGPGVMIHTATVLSSGQVLVTGGAPDNASAPNLTLQSAELYDPNGLVDTPTGKLNNSRGYHTATLLQNNMVLVAGGFDANGNVLNTAELYDPVGGSFALTGQMSNARAIHTAVLLTSGPLVGQVLVVGGVDANGAAQTSAEVYNPTTGKFLPVGNLNVARASHTATLLQTGKVLIAGGAASGAALNSAELFDPTTAMFSTTGPMTTARTAHTATLLQ
jgi:hypothetical protein